MPKTHYDNLWQNPVVRVDPGGAALVCIDRHPVREVADPQAFGGRQGSAGRSRPMGTGMAAAAAGHPADARDIL